jgi:ABC-type branched-subunit amino acid transport system ATPase component/branched-subunit amino acid ABC-type transport system permease component
MNTILPFLIAGITSGAIYGLNAAGLSLTYRTSGVFNFALGAFGTLSSAVFYWLHVEHNMPWPLAALISIVVLGTGLGLILERIGRVIIEAEVAYQVAATIGLVISIEAIFTLWYGASPLPYPAFLPVRTVNIGGTYVTVSQMIIIGASLVLVVSLYAFLRVAKLGKVMRAVVDNPNLVSLSGSNPNRARRWAWVIGSNVATFAGVAIAPGTSLDPQLLTLLIVASFAGAAFGAFSSLPWSFAGGLIIGVGTALATKYLPSGNQWLQGIPTALPFLVLLIALVVTPKRRLALTGVRSGFVRPRSTTPWQLPLRASLPIAGLFIVFLLFMPTIAGVNINSYSIALADLILFLSLGLLVRVSRQVVMCQYVFAGIGAATMGHLITDGFPWALALIVAGLIVVPVGCIVALPAMRLSGVFLGLATLGFGLFVEQAFYTSPAMFGQLVGGVPIPRPKIGSLFNADSHFYYLMLGLAVLISAGMVVLTRGRLGRLLTALGDAPTALETGGVSLNLLRLLVFCLSAFLAAVSGGLMGAVNLYATGAMFGTISSLVVFSLIIFIPGSTPWYAVQCAFGFAVLPILLPSSNAPLYLQTLFGVFAIMTAYQRGTGKGTEAVPPFAQRFINRLLRIKETERGTDVGQAVQASDRRVEASPARQRLAVDAAERIASGKASGLAVAGLSVRFGGVRAVSGLDLVVPRGQITGLIGPNGAGKSTTFNACCGLVACTSGTISLGGARVDHLSTSARSRRGLGRSFQQGQLYDSFGVRGNVALGTEARLIGSSVPSHFLGNTRHRREIEARTESALSACGITEIANEPVAELPSGLRRLVELARVLAGGFDVLLLDEPSSGLNHAETARFGEILLSVAESEGCGILLVEHDMSLVMDVCSYIYVMDFGKLIFEGTPDEVQASHAVQAAYLGVEEVGDGEHSPSHDRVGVEEADNA